jgi:hypothetical protein
MRPVSDTLYYPLDTRACVFWLPNRQRRLWNGRTGAPDGVPDWWNRRDAASEPPGEAGS